MTVQQRNFWLAVRDCLCIMHGMGSQDAGHLIQQFTDLLPRDDYTIYQHEPFWVACSLRNTDLDIRQWLHHYLIVLKANGR